MPDGTLPPSTASRFVFRGNAMPIGGRVLRVRDDRTPQNLQSPPGSVMSASGGSCQATSPGSVFRDIFAWGQCVAQSQGEARPDGSHVTTVTASVQNVRAANGKNVFQAGQLRLTLISIHPVQGQPSIVPVEVIFGGDKGITLNDQKITLTTDLDDFKKLGTLEQLDSEFQRNKKFFDRYRGRFLSKQSKPLEFGQPIPRVTGGYVVCSIVSAVQWGRKKIPGNVLELTGFGKIFFGEILISEYARRMTLVRLAMGSDVQADVSFAEGDTNGSFQP